MLSSYNCIYILILILIIIIMIMFLKMILILTLKMIMILKKINYKINNIFNLFCYIYRWFIINQLDIIKNKEKLQKKTHKPHQNLFKNEKLEKQQHGQERYKNLLEKEKRRLIDYRKSYYRRFKRLLLFLKLPLLFISSRF